VRRRRPVASSPVASDYDHRRADRHAIVKVDDVVVEQPDGARRHAQRPRESPARARWPQRTCQKKRLGDPASVGITTMSTTPITKPSSFACIVVIVPGAFLPYK
jgi:hypothetical protein